MESRKSVNVYIPYSPANEKRKLTKCRWSSLPLLLLSSEHVWPQPGAELKPQGKCPVWCGKGDRARCWHRQICESWPCV